MEVKRYGIGSKEVNCGYYTKLDHDIQVMKPYGNGDYVLYTDFEKVKQKLEWLEGALERLVSLGLGGEEKQREAIRCLVMMARQGVKSWK